MLKNLATNTVDSSPIEVEVPFSQLNQEQQIEDVEVTEEDMEDEFSIKIDFIMDLEIELGRHGYTFFSEYYDIEFEVDEDSVHIEFTVELYDEQEKANEILSEKFCWEKFKMLGYLCINATDNELSIMFSPNNCMDYEFADFLRLDTYTDSSEDEPIVYANNMSNLVENKKITAEEAELLVKFATKVLAEYRDIYSNIYEDAHECLEQEE